MDHAFAQFDAWIVAVALAVLMLLGWRLGRRRGRRSRLHGGDENPSDKFDDASIMLLSLLLAFTFGMSINKYDHRRLALVADSNSIGDFYTCASLVKEPTRSELQQVIREYAELRLQAAQGIRDSRSYDELEDALTQIQQMQSRMTDLVGKAIAEGTPVAIPLVNTLNSLTSSHASRLAAIRDRLPASIVGLLLISAVLSIFLVGREQGRAGDTEIVGTLCFILLVSLAVYVTLALNLPGNGTTWVSQEPLERLIQSMSK